MNNLASIDKLNLLISDFDLKDSIFSNSRWSKKYKSKPISASADDTYLTNTQSGIPIIADGLFLNIDNFNIDIMNNRSGSLGMLISMNPNKFSDIENPFNYQPSDFHQCVKSLNYTLIANDVECDISSAQIIRLDACKQKIMPYPLMSYHPIFAQMGAKRQFEATYRDTFRFQNGQRETAIYDKQKESNLSSDYANLMRIENRFKKSASVARYTPFSNLSQVIDSISHNGYDEITSNYNHYLMSEVLATYNPNITYLNDTSQLLSVLAQESPNRILDRLLGLRGIEALIGDFGSIENIAQIITDMQNHSCGKSARQFKYRITKKLLTYVEQSHALRTMQKDRTSMLYDDIYAFAQ